MLIGATRQTDGRPEGSHSDVGATNYGTPLASTMTWAGIRHGVRMRHVVWLLHVAEGHGRRWLQGRGAVQRLNEPGMHVEADQAACYWNGARWLCRDLQGTWEGPKNPTVDMPNPPWSTRVDYSRAQQTTDTDHAVMPSGASMTRHDGPRQECEGTGRPPRRPRFAAPNQHGPTFAGINFVFPTRQRRVANMRQKGLELGR